MSPRAAGNDPFYTWKLQGGKADIKLPSVTTILREVFGAPQHVVTWATKFADANALDAFRKKRQEEGTAAHEFAENYSEGLDVQPATGFDEAFVKFVQTEKPEFVFSEQVVYSLKHGYAGTLDTALLGPGGSVIVCDYKTRNPNVYQAYTSDKLQCAAYYVAAVEMSLIKAQDDPKIAVLLLKENKRYTYKEYPAPVSAWLAVLKLWKEL